MGVKVQGEATTPGIPTWSPTVVLEFLRKKNGGPVYRTKNTN
jgi:hypothetical protein